MTCDSDASLKKKKKKRKEAVRIRTSGISKTRASHPEYNPRRGGFLDSRVERDVRGGFCQLFPAARGAADRKVTFAVRRTGGVLPTGAVSGGERQKV